MKIAIRSMKLALLSMTLLVGINCSKDKDEPIDLNQTVTAVEVRTILNTDDQLSAVDQVVTQLFQNQVSGKSSAKNDCYTTDYTDTGYSVTFDGCSFEGSDTISGSLTVTYVEGEETTAFTATYTDLMVGDIKINGTRAFTLGTISENESVNFTVVTDMKITLADGSVVEEAGTKNFFFDFDLETIANSALAIDGQWTVTIDGDTYVVSTTSPLRVSLLGCDWAGAGVLNINKNGLSVSVDFGDGTCDSKATITYPDGTVEEISLDD